MEYPENEHHPKQTSIEQLPGITKTNSFTDQLLAPSLANSDIPYEIRMNPSFLNDVTRRKKLLEAYTGHLANQEDVETIETLYKELSEVFNTDTTFDRAALYIPFNLLPTETAEEDISETAAMFIKSYKRAFTRLLDQVDFRADFMDGDVLEPDMRDGKPPEQIVKAIHLLPELMKRSIFSQEEVATIVRETKTAPRIQALVDVMPILYKNSFIDDAFMDELTSSSHESLRNLPSRITREPQTVSETTAHDERTPKELFDSFLSSHRALEQRITSESVSNERKHWKVDMRTERLQNDFAVLLAPHVRNDLTTETIDAILAQGNPLLISLLVAAIRTEAGIEFETEQAVSEHTVQLITHILSQSKTDADALTTKEFKKLAAYAYHYGVTSEPFEEAQFAHETDTPRTLRYFESLSSCANFIENDPLLARCLYPITLSLGSHAKGYAHDKSDTDMGVFVKPEIQESEREAIQEKLNEMLTAFNIKGSWMEFWIEEHADGITIKNYDNPDHHRGDSSLTHPLTGQWVGNTEVTKALRQNILRMYLESTDATIDNKDARTVWLHDLEHNILQYRLMHKGYASHFPPEKNKEETSSTFSIDGESMFYDEGYRKIAFELYLKKVFLPVYTADK